MKKRWFVTVLFALALCLCALPAQAAVTTGGEEYLWYVKYGEILQNENYETVGYEGDSLWLSRDGGASYAELPGLREESRRTWGRMDAALTPLDNGGLRVEARDRCSEEYTWRRDYSAAELVKAFAKEEPNPVEVLAANERVAVGCRLVQDQENGDPSLPGSYGHSHAGEKSGYRLVRSSDGVNWVWTSEQPEDVGYSSELWWDGGVFWLSSGFSSGWSSPDGDHWAEVGQVPIRNTLALTADCGRYHFEAVMPRGSSDEWYNEVYLMEGKERDKGVLLPHMGEGIRANGIGINEMTASPGPNGTVVLTVSGTAGSFSMDYPTSSLDWCMENLSKPFREETQPAAEVSNNDGTVTLAKVAEHFRNGSTYEMEGELLRCAGGRWSKVENTPFSPVFELLPYNGKTFMDLDTAVGQKRLYASEDGLEWSEVTAMRPQELDESNTWGYANYTVIWTGKGYYAGLKAGERRHGMMGHAGGSWYGKNSVVWLLNENFEIQSSYDFGRLVEKIGYLDGTYYAQVSNSQRASDSGFDWGGEGSTLYRSTDGGTWEAMPALYLELDGMMMEERELKDRQGHFPTGDPAKPQRSIAQAGGFRFMMDDQRIPFYENGEWSFEKDGTWVYLGGNHGMVLNLMEMNWGILNNWITPGELEAEVLADGGIKVTVTDLSTPSMSFSYTYTAEDLNSRIAAEENFSFRGSNANYNVTGKPGTANLRLLYLPLGETELLYQRDAFGEAFTWYDSVPWSNSIDLLPFSGKDFMVYDPVDGKLWLSADGITWREATGNWIHEMTAPDRYQNRIAILWVGDKYMAICSNADMEGGNGEYSLTEECSKVFFLDEELGKLSSCCFDGESLERIGYQNGVYYVQGIHCYRSTDGVNWEPTDVMVQECLRELGT